MCLFLFSIVFTGQLLHGVTATGTNTTVLGKGDLLFFNRVPKVGSQMMMSLMEMLSKQNNFDFYRDGGHKALSLRLTDEEENAFVKVLAQLPTPAVYSKHIPFVNFTQSNQSTPIYINMVRHPVDRVISWFYYIRNPDVRASYEEMNPTGKNTSQKWLNKGFESCVRNKDEECRFLQGDKVHTGGNGWSQMMFFCGFDKRCSEPDGAWALERAKSNVEGFYAVVGILEDLTSTLKAFEKEIPGFFKGALNIYHSNEKTLSSLNKNTYKPQVSDEVKEFVQQRLPREMEFYKFCEQRIHKQTGIFER